MSSSAQNQVNVSKYVTLVSSDGFEFVLLREAACHSSAIRKMLDGEYVCPSKLATSTDQVIGNYREAIEARCKFEEIKYVPTLFVRSRLLPAGV